MPTTLSPTDAIVALDVGDRRVGVARASLAARLPTPLTTLLRGADFFDQLLALLEKETAAAIVIGLPRNLSGEETDQTTATRTFIAELHERTELPLYTQDEALTSKKALKELEASGKPYQRGDVDALAAAYILEDFLAEHAAVSDDIEVGRP